MYVYLSVGSVDIYALGDPRDRIYLAGEATLYCQDWSEDRSLISHFTFFRTAE